MSGRKKKREGERWAGRKSKGTCEWDCEYVGSVPSLSCSVQRYALFLRVLSRCHSAPIFPLPFSCSLQRMETKQWGQTDLERELPFRPLNFCYPRAPRLVYLSKPPRWNMERSNPKQPSPSFIRTHIFTARSRQICVRATEPWDARRGIWEETKRNQN